MRNLIDHPITDQEIVACLKAAALDMRGKDFAPGDMAPILLETAADIIASRKLAIPIISADDLMKHLPVIEKRVAALELIAQTVAQCLVDNRTVETGGEVFFLAGGHRRIRLADALRELNAPSASTGATDEA